ncbi:MAG: polysaccharide deacetylase family protein [Clostridia bacterium]|nr:MAG: polysaccharide deacetylase family protein [Clostridia bacterium]
MVLVVSFGGRRFWRRLALILFVLLAAGVLWEPVQAMYVAGGRKVHPIYQVDTSERKVAFSFDACWGAEYTDLILDILDRHQVKTTFFLVNIWLEKYPGQAREIARRGHEIGLHSTTHPHFTRLSPEKMQQELEENAKLVREITGYAPRLFRPPFGDYDDTVIQVAQSLGFQPVQWSVDSLDWQDKSADEIFRRVSSRLEPGAIVLFHNNGKYTAQALEGLLNYARSEGYTVVPVSDLLLKGDYYIDVNGIQRPGPRS